MLELRQITKRFGDVLANDHVDIVVKPGTIHAIVRERRGEVDGDEDRVRFLHG